MDQASFRDLLASQSTTGSSSRHASGSTSHAGGSRGGSSFAGGRQRLGLGASSNSSNNGIPSAQKNSIDQFKPRIQNKGHSVKGKGKAEEETAAKSNEPTYKRYGYTDRASMRRAGIDEDEAEQQEERRPRGLDLSKLDAARRALLQGSDNADGGDVPTEDVPPKTEEEIERELADAEKSLIGGQLEPDGVQKASPEKEVAPPPKKQKKSRSDMLRDLQAKIAAATSGTVSNLSVTDSNKEELTHRSKPSKAEKAVVAEPAKFKGFKVVERAPEKKKKSKKQHDSSDANGPAGVGSITAESAEIALSTVPGDHAVEAYDPDADIFAGAGDYDDGLSADEDTAEEGEEKEDVSKAEKEQDAAAGPAKYFDDQDEIIPKFQTYRSPTPPPRRRSGSPQQSYHGTGLETENAPKSQRLEGFSTSQYSARDLLEADKALEREEKRKLRKLKGQEKKEEAARIAELDGRVTQEQKEKDKLNREAQEYENYERKKQKRSRADS